MPELCWLRRFVRYSHDLKNLLQKQNYFIGSRRVFRYKWSEEERAVLVGNSSLHTS